LKGFPLISNFCHSMGGMLCLSKESRLDDFKNNQWQIHLDKVWEGIDRGCWCCKHYALL